MSIRNKSVAVLAGLAVFAVVSASAATLGGLETNDLGANSNAVAGPIAGGVAISWTTAYSTTIDAYAVTGATLTTIDGTESIDAGSEVELTLLDSTGAVLGNFSGTGATLGSPSVEIAAHDVAGASLVINGGTVSAAVTTTK